jgi:activating signal cointegrator complex subunit 3
MDGPPRLSTVLRFRSGDTSLQNSRENLSRESDRASSTTSIHHPRPAQGTLNWETFAGPLCQSQELHTRSARKIFLKFLGSVQVVAGSDESSSEVIAAEAYMVYSHFCSPISNSDSIKTLSSNLSLQLHCGPISSSQYKALKECVLSLEEWRKQQNLPSPFGGSPTSSTTNSDRKSTKLVGGKIIFSPLSSAYKSSVLQLILNEEYTPFDQIDRINSAGSPNSDLSDILRSTSSAVELATLAPASINSLSRNTSIDAVWLLAQCTQFVSTFKSELTPESIGCSILEMIQKHKSEDFLQNSLFDLLGDSGIEFMFALLEHRATLSTISPQDFKRVISAVSIASSHGQGGFPSRERPVMGSGVTVIHEDERKALKEKRKGEKKLQKAYSTLSELQHDGVVTISGNDGDNYGRGDALEMLGFSREYLEIERSLGLQGGDAPPIYGNIALKPKQTHAFTEGLSADEIISAVGAGFGGATKKALPEGTTETINKEGGYREYSVPPRIPPGGRDIFEEKSRLVPISSMDPLAQQAFSGISHLNRLQSELFETAYRSSENLLVCAPTGAGKTNVAMLTVCREIAQNLTDDGTKVQLDAFKIVYVAPMKALAQEVVAKFSQRLSSLGISVRELTGDMQLSKQEISATQIIVTTPEKWDVVTRKSGDGSLVALVRLLIIDEVHLLADERGAVIESIVARTLRLVEASQSVIRIVGLSATLPNYKDVGQFLRVNPNKGLFYFDGMYRPVPLQQTFVGVTETNQMKRVNIMNQISWDKAIAAIKRGKQVMVFVHSRKDTAKTARALRDIAVTESSLSLLSPFGIEASDEKSSDQKGTSDKSGKRLPPSSSLDSGSATSSIQGEGRVNLSVHQWIAMQKDVENSRNAELRELFPCGFGMHHAGMLRSDRNLTERMFAAGVIKILCCTATLAWGVNLPAHTVIIKGTSVYNAEQGGFADLGILDVMQIFGRAGRPQFDTSGEGIIITGNEKLAHYLGMLTAQVPIESSFIKALPDHLNAEIVSGTVTNVREAVLWLSYTYLYVRMMKNPLVYGITHEEHMDDPLLDAKRLALITQASVDLNKYQMIRFDPASGNMAVTDLGRVASHYYVVCQSVDTFNRIIEKGGMGAGGKGQVSDESVIGLICQAHEFEQIKVRDEELQELDFLKEEARIKCSGDVANTHGKVNVLLQAYISNVQLRSFTLISDTAYITQSAGRLSRALFEMSLKRGWLRMAERFLTLSKAVDKRTWWSTSPLRQFMGFWGLAAEVIKKLEESGTPIDELADLQPLELGGMVRHPKLGPRIWSLVRQIPRLDVEYQVQPITRNVLRLTLSVYPNFDWAEKVHGLNEPWWLWVADTNGETIYHSEYLSMTWRQVVSGEPIRLVFTIPVFEPLPTQYWLHCISDRWIGLSSAHEISFKHLILPSRHSSHTDLLDLLPLPRAALRCQEFEDLYKFTHFNPVQTQMFFTVYNTDHNVLLGAPTGSGKTVAAELAVFRLLRAHPGMKAVYVAPLKALVSERMKDWQLKFGQRLGKKVVELTGDVTPDALSLRTSDIVITTPEKWDGITRGWQKRNFVKDVGLVIFDEVHLLGEDRGPVLEVIVSRMRYIASKTGRSIRFQGLSTALANARDLATWLGVEDVGLFNFRPSVRPIPMETHVKGFPGQAYCPRMATMNKPAYAAICTYSPDKPVLVFVSSRRQTRLTALELISLCATSSENPRRFLRMSEDEMANYIERIKDSALQHTLAFGVGIHHAGLADTDRAIVEELFCSVKIQVLVCTSTLAWGVNFPAHLVIVKGTEYFDAKVGRYVDFPVTDVLQMMGRAGRPQFDTRGVSVILVHEAKKDFYKKFLYEPFPVESQLRLQLHEHINAEIIGGTIKSRSDAVDWLTWTYFYRRLVQNPAFYELDDVSVEGVKTYLYAIVDDVFRALVESQCVVLGIDAVESLQSDEASSEIPSEDEAVAPTTLGVITSYYYLSYTSAGVFADRLQLSTFLHPSVEDMCRLLCDSPEFAEVPVRHNEDELNEKFSQKLPWDSKGSDFSSPHVKSLLLLQARLARAPVPITDYVNDTKSVLDQSLRVLNSLVDVAADFGKLRAAFSAMLLTQCLVQAQLPDQSEITQLPHIEDTHAATLSGILGFRSDKDDEKMRLSTLAGHSDEEIKKALTSQTVRLSNSQASDVLKVLHSLPWLQVTWTARQGSATLASKSTSTEIINVQTSSDTIDVEIEIQAPTAQVVGRNAWAPRFRQKTYSWWIIISNSINDELLAIKRISQHSGQARHNLSVDSPTSVGSHEWEISVISDTLRGLDVKKKLSLIAS